MSSDPLHPNLARIAATYDQITADWASGRMTVEEARTRLGNLTTRDDQGVHWRINSETGEWERQTLDGLWATGTPPTWGLATPDGWDLSGGTDPFGDPRRRLEKRVVDPSRVTDTAALSGATIRVSNAEQEQHTEPSGARWGLAVLIAAVTTLVLIFGVKACTPTDEPPTAPGSTAHTTATAGPAAPDATTLTPGN